MPDLRRVGTEAEDRAADYLLGLGYTLVTRRHKTARGELDLVALDGELLVVVEVKFRRTRDALPEESITRHKLRHLTEAIAAYLHEIGEPGREFRLDVIAIDPDGLRHHRDILAP